MGTGDWFKNIIHSKKKKNGKPKSLKGSPAPQDSNVFSKEPHSQSETTADANKHSNRFPVSLTILDEGIAAIRIQNAFRVYRARKVHRHLKGTVRLRTLTVGGSVRKQASTTLSHLHTWSRIQAEIRARRISMATEARIRQKKLENQLKLEAKLHGLEVEWNGGTDTMEEVLARIHLREAAAVKRERAMAYAFSHQWRANSNPVLGNYELGKAIWGWSWRERWIAARPWESRAVVSSTPKKAAIRQQFKNGKNVKSPSIKSISPNGKLTKKAQKLSYGIADKEANTTKEQIIS